MDAPGVLRLVGEPTRHALLHALRESERTVAELTAAIAGEQSNVSHHLRGLRQAGLVAATPDGRERRYRLSHPDVKQALEEIDRLAWRLDRIIFTAGLGLPLEPSFHGYG